MKVLKPNPNTIDTARFDHQSTILLPTIISLEIISILRNLKIIGIFTRLAFRDGKKKYLRLIQHAWKLIEVRINQNKLFLDLKQLLHTSFKGKLNEN